MERNMKFEYVLPSSWWTETADSHCLLIHVPGFKKDEVRIRTDSDDHVTVSGERQANDTTVLHFAQAYKVPDDCNIQDTRAILEEDETYYVIIPKKLDSRNENPASTSDQTEEEHRAQESVPDGDESNQNREEAAKEESSDTSIMKKLAKVIMKKRCLVLTALVALSLGLLVSQRSQSTSQQFKADEGLISHQNQECKKRAEDDA